jgi:subtilisin-like proprotein convertase family protein
MKKIYFLLLCFITFNGYSQVCKTETNSTSTPISSTSPATLTVTVPDNVPITDLNVCINLTHPYLSDLVITLTSPANTTIRIINPNQCQGANINATFDDSGAPLSCGATITGISQALENLATFNGEMAAGVWTLTVIDTLVIDDGVLNSFCIEYCTNTLSMPEIEAAAAFTMFPNPAKNTLSFSTQEKINVTLYDIYGRNVLTKKVGVASRDIDISKVASGNYLVEVITENNKRVIKKLIVE